MPSSASRRDLLQEALVFATEAHAGQRRKDRRTPYIVHPVAVVRLLTGRMGVTDPTLLAAAALHDVVEDTPTTLAKVQERFGGFVADIVEALTLPPEFHGEGVSDDRKTERLVADVGTMPWEAVVVKLADRWDNLTDSATVVDLGIWSSEKVRRFRAQSQTLLEAIEARRRTDPPPVALQEPLVRGLAGVRSALAR